MGLCVNKTSTASVGSYIHMYNLSNKVGRWEVGTLGEHKEVNTKGAYMKDQSTKDHVQAVTQHIFGTFRSLWHMPRKYSLHGLC